MNADHAIILLSQVALMVVAFVAGHYRCAARVHRCAWAFRDVALEAIDGHPPEVVGMVPVIDMVGVVARVVAEGTKFRGEPDADWRPLVIEHLPDIEDEGSP